MHLPARARQLLLLAALEGSGDLHVLQAIAGGRVDDLAPAEQARLVDIDQGTGRLAFRHPLTDPRSSNSRPSRIAGRRTGRWPSSWPISRSAPPGISVRRPPGPTSRSRRCSKGWRIGSCGGAMPSAPCPRCCVRPN